MFYSRAAHKLSGVEPDQRNATRIRLRRVGGAFMFMLAIAFFVGFQPYVWESHLATLVVWMVVLLLLLGIVVLGLLDLRLTLQLRRPRK